MAVTQKTFRPIPQIENRKDFRQIPVQEALSEQNKPKSHHDQHRFVSDRDDHQNYR